MNSSPATIAIAAHEDADVDTAVRAVPPLKLATMTTSLAQKLYLAGQLDLLEALAPDSSEHATLVLQGKLLLEGTWRLDPSFAKISAKLGSWSQSEHQIGFVPASEQADLSSSNNGQALSSESAAAQEVSSSSDDAAFSFMHRRSSPVKPGVQASLSRISKLREQALADLDDIDEWASELGVAPPDVETRAVARTLLLSLLSKYPAYYQVYPRGEGKIEISVSMHDSHIFFILLKPSGKVSCYLLDCGRKRQAHYSTANLLPDGFFRDALASPGDRAFNGEQDG